MFYFALLAALGTYDEIVTWYVLHFVGVREVSPIGKFILSKLGQKGIIVIYCYDLLFALYIQYLSTIPLLALFVGYVLSSYIITTITNTFQFILLIKDKPPRKEVWSPNVV